MSVYLKKLGTKLKDVILDSVLEIFCTNIRVTSTPSAFGGIRFWFMCPQCEKRLLILLIHPFREEAGCRECLGVRYHKSRFKGMLEADFA